MPRTTIVEVVNLARGIEEEMPTPYKSRQSQPLSNNDESNEELTNDEYKKEIRKNCKEHDDEC
jgi:hypothetical protein